MSATPITPKYVNAAGAAAYLGVSLSTIRGWYRSGRLVRYYLTAHPSFLVADLDALAENAPNFPPGEDDR